MKIVVRLLNVLIMALSLAAAVLLFVMPAFSFNSNIALDVNKFSEFVPKTDYTSELRVADSLGTDQIQVAIKFKMNLGGVAKSMSGNRDVINSNIVSQNVDDIVDTLHEPVDLITDYSIRAIIKSTIKAEITKQIENAKDSSSSSTAAEIMEESNINDEYFTNFSYELYNSTNEDGATTESVSNVLYWQINEAINKAQQAGQPIDGSKFTDKMNEINTNMAKVLNDLKLVKSDGTLVKLSEVSYFYLSNYLKEQLKDKVDAAELEQKSNETLPDYADRMISAYVLTQMPDVFYKAVGGVCIGLFIGIFLFTAIWLFLFVWTLLKTFAKKPFTFFGPIFWIVGSLQLVLGLGLTIFGKFILPKIKINMGQIPIKSFVVAPRTYALVPSILFLVAIPVAVGYFIFKCIAKPKMDK